MSWRSRDRKGEQASKWGRHWGTHLLENKERGQPYDRDHRHGNADDNACDGSTCETICLGGLRGLGGRNHHVTIFIIVTIFIV